MTQEEATSDQLYRVSTPELSKHRHDLAPAIALDAMAETAHR